MQKAMIFTCGIVAGILGTMLYLHRQMIVAAVKGEEMPEAPEGCPAYQGNEE